MNFMMNTGFGLIESNWGGTMVEAWMPQEPLDLCGIELLGCEKLDHFKSKCWDFENTVFLQK